MGTCLQLTRTTPFTKASFVPTVLQLRHPRPSSLSNFYRPNGLNLFNGKPLYSRSHFHCSPCQASASWPYENRETDEDYEKLHRSWIDSFDWDGGLEVLAMVSGVAVSLAFLASRRGASGLPVSVYIIVFLMAGMGALRHQIGYLWKSVKAKSVNAQTSMGKQLLNFQSNLRSWEDSISKKVQPQLFLKRSENHLRSPGNAAGSPESPTTNEKFGKSSILVLKSSAINGQSEGHDRESCKESSTSGANVEVVVTDIAKCVAQLAEVVVNLEGKISNMESTGLQRKPSGSVNEALTDNTSERGSSLELLNSLKEASSTVANSVLPVEIKVLPALGSESNDVMQNEANTITRTRPLVLEHLGDQRVDRSSVAFQPQQATDTIPSDIYTSAIENGVYAEQELFEDATEVQNMDTARSWREAVIRSRHIHSSRNTEETHPLVLEGGYKNLDASPPLNMDSPAQAAELDTDRVLSGGEVQWMGRNSIASYSNKRKSSQSVPLDSGFTSLDSGDIDQESDSMLMKFQDFTGINEPESYNLQVTEPSGDWVNKEAGVRLPRDDATLNGDKVHLMERILVVAEGPQFLPSESGVVSSSLDEGVPINGVEAMRSQYIKGSRQEESRNQQGRKPSSNGSNVTAGDWLTGSERDDLDSYNSSSVTTGPSLRNGDDYGNSQQLAMSSNRSRSNAAVLDVTRNEFGAGSRPQYGTSVKESYGNREINLLRVASKEKTSIGRRGFELRATQSSASRDDFSFSQGNVNRLRDEGEEMGPQVGVSWEAQQSRNVTDESLYDRSQRGTGMSSGSQESWEGPSSSGRDSDQRSRRRASSEDANVEAFGRDGGYTEDTDNYNAPGSRKSGNDSGNRQLQQSSSRGSDIDADSSQELGTDPPAVRNQGSRPLSPSYPTEAYKNQRYLPVLRSKLPEDDRSQQILDEVDVLLTEGREGLEGRIEVGVAERMLYEAADLCAKAVALRPSSLVAVGMWGNTLLLHGELKLRLSQNLRSMLPEPSLQALSRRDSWEDEQDRQALEATLQEVCEECEELLVEAGRKYRLGLSMDRSDMRALYNWGLALCYRGQLIAEEGGEVHLSSFEASKVCSGHMSHPEQEKSTMPPPPSTAEEKWAWVQSAAQDADKVYLAAIDKFEAMMGLSDSYASGALLNWGLAMRDRSRLRPMGSKERIKILAQAKEIFQEALRLDPNYGQARGAVTACTVELKELQEYIEPRDSMDGRETRGRQEGLWQPKNWWR